MQEVYALMNSLWPEHIGIKYRKEKQKWDSRIKSKIEFFLSQKQKEKTKQNKTQDTEWDQFWWHWSSEPCVQE